MFVHLLFIARCKNRRVTPERLEISEDVAKAVSSTVKLLTTMNLQTVYQALLLKKRSLGSQCAVELLDFCYTYYCW